MRARSWRTIIANPARRFPPRLREALFAGGIALPTPRDDGDNAGESVHVARVDHLGGRMRIPQRPAERDVHRAVGDERRAVVAACGDAKLHGNLIRAREFYN